MFPFCKIEHFVFYIRSDSHGNAGCGPMSQQELMGSLADQQYVLVDRAQVQEGSETLRGANRPQNGRTLSESSAWKGEMEPEAGRPSTTDKETNAMPPSAPPSFSRARPPPAPVHISTLTGEEIKELNRVGISGFGDMKNSFTRYCPFNCAQCKRIRLASSLLLRAVVDFGLNTL